MNALGRHLFGFVAGWALFLIAQELVLSAARKVGGDVDTLFMILATLVGIGASLVAGEVAASSSQSRVASSALALMVAVVAFGSLIVQLFTGGLWWSVIVLLILAPCIVLGGHIGFDPAATTVEADEFDEEEDMLAPPAPPELYPSRFWASPRPWGALRMYRRWFQ